MQNIDAVILETIEKQEDIICRLSRIVKKQAYEIAHIKNLYGYDISPDEEVDAQQMIKEYEQLKSEK